MILIHVGPQSGSGLRQEIILDLKTNRHTGTSSLHKAENFTASEGTWCFWVTYF